jgi:AcrR family transcriptional regulator
MNGEIVSGDIVNGDIVLHKATPEAGLHVSQVLAIEAMVVGSTVVAAAEAAGVSRATVHRWLASDAEFIAALNRAKQEHLGHVQSELRSLATDAVAVLKEVLRPPAGKFFPNALRYKVSIAVLKMVGADSPEKIGFTDASDVRRDNALADALRSFASFEPSDPDD